jgi:RND family efflux transporter MFP subunit
MKTLLTLIILGAALAVTTLLLIFTPDAQETSPPRPVTTVQTIVAQPETVQLSVQSQGTLLPRIESELSAEVSGRIIEVAENFRAGGSFAADDLLLRIDPADYEAAVAAQAAELANAQLALAQEEAQAEQAAADWAALGRGEASPLTLREPQLAQARARLESARASLERARRDLRRTEIRAPYAGRVLQTQVDLGQYVSAAPAAPLARVFALDRGELRLPLTPREAELLNLDSPEKAAVQLRRAGSAQSQTWTARLDRMEATIDPGSRLIYAVAVLEQPFSENPKHPEVLRRGQFLDATIEGRRLEGAYQLPRYALRGSDTVYLVTDEQTLVTREVSIVHSNAEVVVIPAEGGLAAGDRVATSPIAYFAENMPVEILED